MTWTIPGTVLQVPRENPEAAENLFSSMFLAGGMVLSQVSSVTGLAPYTVQNWVKRGFLSPPEKKKYSLRQLCRILNIHMLKDAMPMERICAMLGYINGQLDDEQDDIIDDSVLYFAFVRLAAQADDFLAEDDRQREQALERALEHYNEPIPGAKDRVKEVLRIMLTAWLSVGLQRQAQAMFLALPIQSQGEM